MFEGYYGCRSLGAPQIQVAPPGSHMMSVLTNRRDAEATAASLSPKTHISQCMPFKGADKILELAQIGVVPLLVCPVPFPTAMFSKLKSECPWCCFELTWLLTRALSAKLHDVSSHHRLSDYGSPSPARGNADDCGSSKSWPALLSVTHRGSYLHEAWPPTP